MYHIPTTRSAGMAIEKYCAPTVCKAFCQMLSTQRGVRLKSEGWRNTKLEAGCSGPFYDYKAVGTVPIQVHKPGNEFVRLPRVSPGVTLIKFMRNSVIYEQRTFWYQNIYVCSSGHYLHRINIQGRLIL